MVLMNPDGGTVTVDANIAEAYISAGFIPVETPPKKKKPVKKEK